MLLKKNFFHDLKYWLFFYLALGFSLGFLLGLIMPFLLQYFWAIQGCFLCKIQQYIFLGLGFVNLGYLCFFFFRKKSPPLFFLLLCWLCLGLAAFYHSLIQEGFLSSPAFCKAFDAQSVEDFLTTTSPPCHKKTLVIFGLSAPIYNIFLSFFFGGWGYGLRKKVLEKNM